VIGDIFQPTHLLFILVIVLIVLGPKRLPEVARSLGRGLRDFKTAISGEDDSGVNELQQHHQVAPAPPPPPQPAAVGPTPQDPVDGAG
jgi:sec-independent protein translocase protein TatA